MIPYYLTIGVPALYALICSLQKKSHKNKKIVDLFFLIWLLLLIFRSKTLGVDLPVYSMHFADYADLNLNGILLRVVSGNFEIGYIFLSKWTSFIGEAVLTYVYHFNHCLLKVHGEF